MGFVGNGISGVTLNVKSHAGLDLRMTCSIQINCGDHISEIRGGERDNCTFAARHSAFSTSCRNTQKLRHVTTAENVNILQFLAKKTEIA